MEEKTKLLYFYEEKDEYDNVDYQTVSNLSDDTDGVEVKFSVNNLNECPEDAIIGRDLFDATDYLNAIKTGIKLAQIGYTDVRFANIRG